MIYRKIKNNIMGMGSMAAKGRRDNMAASGTGNNKAIQNYRI